MKITRGSIVKKNNGHYEIHKNKGEYITTCTTYEQAYYLIHELQKNNWNTQEIPDILKEYPRYYTELLYFYQYIHQEKSTGDWLILMPRSKSPNNKVQHFRYTHIEDALFERDFLVKHDWDYELLCECIDDTCNPYHIMSIPPYPERRIRNIQKRKTHQNEILLMQELILEEPDIRISELAEKMDCNPQSIRYWLRKYNTNYMDFKTIILRGDNPLEALEFKQIIYQPDLNQSTEDYKKYVKQHNRSTRNPYAIINDNHDTFGWYPTRELAEQITLDLIQTGWDKKQLPIIQEKHGFQPPQKKRNYIYPQGKKYNIRKLIDKQRISYGTYRTREIAEKIRDKLIQCDWNMDQLQQVQTEVAKEYGGIIH